MNPRTFRDLPARARLFILGVEGIAVGLVVFTISKAGSAWPSVLGLTTLRDVAISIGAVLAIIVAGVYPIRPLLGDRVRASVAPTPIFAAVLMFSPARTMFIVASGVFVSQLITFLRRKNPPRMQGWLVGGVAFNAAQSTLAAGLSGLLFHTLGRGSAGLLHLGSVAAVADVGATLLLYLGVNNVLVSTISAMALGRSMLGVWRATVGRVWYLEVSTLLLGIGLAIVFLYAPLGVMAFVIPIIAIRHGFSSVAAVQKQTRETLEALADALDKRDPYTYEHSQRVAEYARLLARRLGLDYDVQESVALAARVHDLGKIGVRDDLLRKPDRLTEDEIQEVRRHTLIGADIVSGLSDYAKSREAILYHHERWDGSGIYRLAYEHIPVGARIIAVADAYDAMTSDRPYRQALSQEEACAELVRGRGTQFDPAVVDAFIAVLRDQPVAERHRLFIPSAEPAALRAKTVEIRH